MIRRKGSARQNGTRLLSDDPAKGEGKAKRHSLLPQRLFDIMGSPSERIDIISSYFVPTRAGVAQLLRMVRKGVKIAILTNSLAANDVAVVHAGYARWRKKLLRYGVELYELKPTREQSSTLHDRGITGKSGASLHAKTFSIDGKTVFIGSFNFDPRSTLLNTEMGFVIESETLAQLIDKRFIERIDIISSYFVPTRAGVAQLLRMVRKGVKIAILTNSLAANDVAVVHAGYARWRKKLLRYGVELYELKATREQSSTLHDRGITGNSGASLHAKTFSIDGKTVFIGSFNFDPRSTLLNTEMGFVIESETLAQLIDKRFIQSQYDAAWQLRLDRWGRINWVDRHAKKEIILKKEPATSFWKRVMVIIQSQYDAAWQLRLDRWGRINWVDRHAKKEIILKKEPATSFWKRVMVKLASILPVEWLL